MIKHCLKIAIRNLVKYKVQSAVSILGLAVGFVCFSLSLYWIHYEMTYDHFRQNADRIYMVRTNDEYTEGKISTRVPYSLAAYLAQHFPDIAVAAPFHLISERISVNDKYQDAVFSSADSAWMNLMDIRIIKGNRNFMLPKDNAEIAITEEAAKKWFRTEDPIGKEVKMLRRTKKICAIVQAENRHTNFPFDFIGNPELGKTWWYITWSILIKVKPDTDIEELESKINANLPAELKQVTLTRKTGIERIILTPLSKLHYAKDFRDDKEAGITFQYIIYFSIAGILIITCALINYLTLFINRMRVRQREMALRMIHGANIRSLVSLLTVEFLLLLACAVTTGFLLIEICFPSFIELTGIDTAINQDLRAIDLNQYTEKKFFVYLYKTLSLKGSGVTVKGIKVDELHNLLIPLPPLAEQQRIVARLEELLPDVEAYGTAQERLTALESSFPQQLRKSLLQEAIQGRLVPQDPTDESADVLLQRIRAEKEQLIKEGKIKKQKPLPPITEEEKPFTIPDSWQWVRLGDLAARINYGFTASASMHGDIKFLRITDIDIKTNTVNWDSVPFCTIDKNKTDSYLLLQNDILIARTGGTIGKFYIVDKKIPKSVFASYLIRVSLIKNIITKYIGIFLSSPAYWSQIIDSSMGTGQPNVNSIALASLKLPLPPLAEQQRIVARLEELLPLCDGILSAGGQA